MKESLPEENAAKDRFLIGVFLDARRDSELNQDALFVNRVPMRKEGSFKKNFYSSKCSTKSWENMQTGKFFKRKFNFVKMVDLNNSINQNCPR